tara:strand:+ start:205 stop:555 length:351 start_codon:yes stop_codon:yes gene_type:complete
MASEAAWHLRVLAETMDREELICNLVTVQMGRDALKKEIDEIQSYLLPPGAFPNTDAFIVKLRELKTSAQLAEIEVEKLKKDNHQLGEAVDALLVGQETLKKENEKLRSPSSTRGF